MNSNPTKTEHYWEEFVEALSTAVLVLDIDGTILYINKAACNLLKKNHHEIINTNFSFPIKTTSPYEIEILTPDNQIVYAELSIQAGKWKKRDSFIATLHDITLRKEQEKKLKISANVFKFAKEGIVITDKNTTIVDVNREFSNITGYRKKEVIGKKLSILKSGKQDEQFYKKMWTQIKNSGYWYGEIWSRKKSGELYPQLLAVSEIQDEDKEITNYLGVFSDISQLENQKRTLQRIAHYDSLTNLPNRVLFVDRLEQAMKGVMRSKMSIAVIFIDIDDFKMINDKYRHHIGDQLLKEFVKLVSQHIQETDTLARYGGDEFLLLMTEIDDIASCYKIMNRIYEKLQHPIKAESHLISVKVSMGITFYPQPENVIPEQLIRQADQAMYKSKIAGKNRITIFDVKNELMKRQDNIVINELRAALKENQLKLYFQPKINMRKLSIIGAEGLLRWEHPTRGLLLLASFLPSIKHDEFLLELTRWTIVTTLEKLQSWYNIGIKIPVSINIDAMQIEQRNFIKELKQLISPYPKPIYELLEFEILESSVISNLELVSSVINQCIELGIEFSLDDFGTGFSSINYLVDLPFKYVKIDMNFIKNILNNPRDIQILKAMLEIAKAVKINVIAEGVETQAHKDLLLELNCHYGQGFAFSKALPDKEFIKYYKNWKK